MKIILVRHGETDVNAAGCYLGHFDAKLNPKGQEQIRQLTKKLKGIVTEGITRLYASDLSRAVESAQIIGEALRLTPTLVSALRELHFGDWECKTYEAIVAQEQELLERWIQNPFQISPPNGETLQQLGKRVDDWLWHILSHAYPDESIIIVSHGGPIRWFCSKWLRDNEQEFWNVKGIPHGKGGMVEFDPQTRIFTAMNQIT
ncbi:MAG: histidine phosphatase family protein [Ectobacillus sp.]